MDEPLEDLEDLSLLLLLLPLLPLPLLLLLLLPLLPLPLLLLDRDKELEEVELEEPFEAELLELEEDKVRFLLGARILFSLIRTGALSRISSLRLICVTSLSTAFDPTLTSISSLSMA